MTERLHFHFSLSCTGEGNGNRLQGSCLENPRDGGAYWAAIYGVAQSRTRLKRLSSSSSSREVYRNTDTQNNCLLNKTSRWHRGEESVCQCRRHRRRRFNPWVGKIPWSRKWQPTPVFLPGISYVQRILAGHSPWDCKELDTTEWLRVHTHTHTHTHTQRRLRNSWFAYLPECTHNCWLATIMRGTDTKLCWTVDWQSLL